MNWATRILSLAALALAGLTFPAAAQQQQWALDVPFSPLPFGVPPPFGAITGSLIVDGPTRRITSWNFTTTPGNGLCTVGLNVSSCGFAGLQYSPANTHLAFDSDTHLIAIARAAVQAARCWAPSSSAAKAVPGARCSR
jgi:hypothetical protein